MVNPPQTMYQPHVSFPPMPPGGVTDGYRWYQPPFVSPPFSQQGQAGGLSAQSWFTDLLPLIPIIVTTVSALQQQGYQLSTPASQS
jgi:hypothetical protein